MFEGEYLNGKRNGKGKEYKYGEIIFEGEYLNGKRWIGAYKDYVDYLLDYYGNEPYYSYSGKFEG